MKKLFVIFFLISNSLHVYAIQPLTNYSFDELLVNENVNHSILEGCVSLYSALTELIINKYPELGNQFYEMANTIYPYGIISLSKIKSLTYKEAEKIFYDNVDVLTDRYKDEMNKNGKINGSYFKGSFLAEDLFFCHEVTKSLQQIILESLDE